MRDQVVRIEFAISSTIAYYGIDSKRLAYNEYGNPSYFTDDGKRCAIARLVRSKYQKRLMKYDEKMRDSVRVFIESFMEEYSIVDERSAVIELFNINATIDDMEHIQEFHDERLHWGRGFGVSKLGVQFLFTFFPKSRKHIKFSLRELGKSLKTIELSSKEFAHV